MDLIREFRDGETIRAFAERIAPLAREWNRPLRMMEVCGGHTHTIAKYALDAVLPENVIFLHGPGCPVCVMPKERIEQARILAAKPDCILVTTGDMMRVPGITGSLVDSRAAGHDVRSVYSPLETLRIARENREHSVIYFAIGFETTAPTTAALIRRAENEKIDNLSYFINHVLVPPALDALLSDPEHGIDALIAPSHVSVITGSQIYEPQAKRYRIPVVVSGFEPVDVMESVEMILHQLIERRSDVEIQYKRCVTREGNLEAQKLLDHYFTVAPSFKWRGLGEIPHSSLALRNEFSDRNAETIFAADLKVDDVSDHRLCICPEILRGKKRPSDCTVFGTRCTPDSPIGACMVSGEGACLAYYRYGRGH